MKQSYWDMQPLSWLSCYRVTPTAPVPQTLSNSERLQYYRAATTQEVCNNHPWKFTRSKRA